MNISVDVRLFSHFKSSFLLLLLGIFFLASCGPTRHLEEDEKLLVKVNVKHQEKKKYNEELKSIAKQKPNRKLLGMFRIYLGIYNLYYHKEDSKIKDKLGEPPVIYDSTFNQISTDLMIKYLNNRGYYDNTVDVKVKERKKKVKMSFQVNKGKQYTIKEFDYQIDDRALEIVYLSDTANSAIKVNNPFDLDLLSQERIRIERSFKNHGYYRFTREYILFKVDTFKSEKTAAVKLVIRNPSIVAPNADTISEGRHEIFTINKVDVRLNYKSRNKVDPKIDTAKIDSILFVNYGDKPFKYKAISRIIYTQPNTYYNLSQQEQTYRNLSSLRLFSYVGIQFDPDYTSNENKLDVLIDLQQRKQKSLTIESEGTNNGGNLGINGTLLFQNNNTFKGAEILNIRFSGGLEAQRILTDNSEDNVIDGFLPFNTLEFGPEINLEVPRFLLPINTDRFSTKGNPRTTFNASYNLQSRPDYRRDITKVYIAYSWNETPTKTHIIQPFDLSYIKLDPSAAFSDLLTTIENPFLRNSYTDNLILATKYSFILNTKSVNSAKNSIFFRGNIETAGNVLSAASRNINNFAEGEDIKEVAGIRFAQYVRTDLDFRYYQHFNLNHLVYRFTVGMGIPYGNSVAMPFEKSFYAGGANGLRAWRARELGPGNLPDTLERNVDQIGNMNILANIEFRFPITNLVEGAAFVDAGNIWNYDQEDSREDTQFKLNRLWNGTALGIGTGIRLNFSFFILRLDVATKFKDPSLNDPNKIEPIWEETNLNLGIGYPF